MSNSSCTDVPTSEYEGAGFFLVHGDNFILSARVKKAKDAEKDPIKEVEHFGGKREDCDNGDPYQTAYAELVEEAGGDCLYSDWRDRVETLQTFQPFSKKWIWCFLLRLTDDEHHELTKLDKAHDDWQIGETRSFFTLTGREEPARKAIEGIATASTDAVMKYIEDFREFHIPGCDNRMKEAKVFGQDESRLFTCSRLSAEKGTGTGTSAGTWVRRLRGFNLVIFEEHIETIKNFLENN